MGQIVQVGSTWTKVWWYFFSGWLRLTKSQCPYSYVLLAFESSWGLCLAFFFWVTSLVTSLIISCSRVLFYDKVKVFFVAWVFNVIVNTIGRDKNWMISFCSFYSLVIDLFCCGCNYRYIALFFWQNVAPGNVNQCRMVTSKNWRYLSIIL